MKRILVPCDFSHCSINAFRFALDIAAVSGGTVHLLNVIELPSVPNTVLTPVRALGIPLMKEFRAKAESSFDKISAQYNREGVALIAAVEFGVPSKTILKYIKKHAIDLVVMGSHGAEGIREYFLGSNAARMVRTAPVPVIVVKSFYKGPVKSIVFPCGLDTENVDGLILKVKELQKHFKAHLHIVWINTPANFTPDTVTRPKLNAFAKRNGLQDFTISIFNHVYEEEGIIGFAESINADMIGMGTHGRKGLSRMVYGSKSENVANHAESLIWTYLIKKR